MLFCHPPTHINAGEFNRENHQMALKVFKKLAPTTRVPASALNYVAPATDGTPMGSKTAAVDKAFFERQISTPKISGRASANALQGGRVTLYPHQRRLADDGTPLPMNRKEKQAMLNEMGMSKKHKKGKKVKSRSGAGYDYM